MKSKLFPLRLNELLDFVRRSHSVSPDHSPLISPVNATSAAWRFIWPLQQRSKLARAPIIQATSSFNYCFGLSRFKTIDSKVWPLLFNRNLTLELTGREAPNQAFNLADENQADSAPVEWVVRFRASLPLCRARSLAVDSIIEGNRRRMATHLTRATTLKACAGSEQPRFMNIQGLLWPSRFKALIFVIQQKPNARIDPTAEALYQAFKLSDEKQANRGRVEWVVMAEHFRPPRRTIPDFPPAAW
jgi:hypothetical protein